MSNTSTTERTPLQRLGENAAYTAKGLFKTGDAYAIKHRVLTIVPMVMGFAALVWPEMPSGLLRVIAFLTLVASFVLLVMQREFEKVKAYHALANKFLALFDHAHRAMDADDPTRINELEAELNRLRAETNELPVSHVGRWWSRRVIHREMDLAWTAQP